MVSCRQMALDGDKVRLFGMSRRTRVARSAGPKSAEGETIREPLVECLSLEALALSIGQS